MTPPTRAARVEQTMWPAQLGAFPARLARSGKAAYTVASTVPSSIG